MKVFISYSTADRLYAFDLFRILEQQKYEVWLDYFDIMPSEKLEEVLAENVAKADVLCIIFSPNSTSSKWVEYEVKAATENKIKQTRIVGIIIHPCEIPAYVSEIAHLDARTGLNDPIIIALLKRTIDGMELKDQDILLDAAKKKELAKQSIIERANTKLPFHVDEIDRLANKKIDSILISIDPDSFNYQEKIVYELILNLDKVFDSPMQFYFTKYDEGKTWPAEFGFSEPSFEDFFMAAKPKIDGKFKWYNDVHEFENKFDATDFNDMAAEFSFKFTGAEFNKGKDDLYMKGNLEFPTIRKLLNDNCTFELIAHLPESKTAKRLNSFNAEIDISFSVSISDENEWLTLFKSRHSYEEELAFSCDFMKNNTNMIFREMAIQGFSNRDTSLQDRKINIATALDEDRELEIQDYSLGAFYCNTQGDVFFFRTDYYEASRWYYKSVLFLQSTVLEKFPSYKEAVTLFHAAERLADCVDIKKDADLKAEYLYNVGVVAHHLIEKFPEENDYKRMMVKALFKNAEMNNLLRKYELSAEDIKDAIEILQTLYDKIPSAENYQELCKYKMIVFQLFEHTPIIKLIPAALWKKDLSALNKNAEKIIEEDNEKQKKGPVWLAKAVDKNWPVEVFKSPLLRYSIAVPKRWSFDPFLSTTQQEINHLFKGPWPSEFLSISFMEKVTGGKMTLWVDSIERISGFPILEISRDTNPSVLEWIYEGKFDLIAEKYRADEAHCYNGIIELNDKNKHRARIYILLLRKENFAWKFILSFETALFPGMPASVVFNNDHVRAGCSFGTLKLG